MAKCLLCSDLAERGGSIDLPGGFTIAADAAPLGPGHALFYTREHVSSFAALEPERLRAAKQVLREVTARNSFAQFGFLAFEHGTSGDGSSAHGCVDHAHIHLLPLAGHSIGATDAMASFQRENVNVGATIKFEDLFALADTEYFWSADNALQPILLYPNKPERQVLRRLIASALRLPSYRTWDVYNLDAAKATTSALRDEFGEMADGLQ